MGYGTGGFLRRRNALSSAALGKMGTEIAPEKVGPFRMDRKLVRTNLRNAEKREGAQAGLVTGLAGR